MAAKQHSGTVRIGISGWAYKPWRGVFYPEKLPRKRELNFASRQFRSIEINGTFYSLQTPASFAKIALVCADAVEWPLLMDVTADFIYCRLHGSEELYSSGYDPAALDTWAARVAAWARGKDAPDGARASGASAPKRRSRDVYVYFDNDAKVRAPVDATGLSERVNQLLHH